MSGERAAEMPATMTRPMAVTLTGLAYSRSMSADPMLFEAGNVDFRHARLTRLCQGTVVYKASEVRKAKLGPRLAVNLDSLMHCAPRLEAHARESWRIVIIR